MSFELADLASLDKEGYDPLSALALVESAPRSHASPRRFVCSDGKSYWLKARAQGGLVVELIAGRLAKIVGAGPIARIISVPGEAIPSGAGADDLLGLVVGIENEPGTENARTLSKVLGSGNFDPKSLNASSRARVIAFQTWLDVGDQQVLVRLADGFVFSIDHGASFGSLGGQSEPTLIVTSIPGADNSVGKDIALASEAAGRIEAVTEDEILRSVAQVPTEDPWQASPQRRLEMARWLFYRRNRIREVMDRWAKT